MWDFIKEYPEIGTLCVATIFTALGFIFKSLIDFLLEKRRKKAELREAFWKEKIMAAKKASEYYFEQLSFYELTLQNLDLTLNEKRTPNGLRESIVKSIDNISERINNPSSFEHHHINIFYDLNQKQLKDKVLNIISELQDIHNFMEQETVLTDDEFKELYMTTREMRNNIEGISLIYRQFLDLIREDLKSNVE
ncbi:hypothetical protein [Thalassobellus citreus]|uniref:hypothetical protein n=1 Tax=Thalassobellus citreus TaxID=3367752 RepID=UPI0037A93415